MADDAHQECSEPVGNPDISLEASHSFVQAGLGEYFCLCLKELEFIAPTPIQYYAIRTAIDRPERSIVAQAKSGTGKTLVYLSLIMQHLSCLLELQSKCYALVIVPTRELALQVHQLFKRFQSALPKPQILEHKQTRNRLRRISLMLAIGGIPFEDDKKNFLFNGGHVVIGTVGRISELVERHVLPSKGFDILVLDEGDKLFENKNKRFEDLLAKISLDRIGSGTNSRQSTRFLIFSATYTQELLKQLCKTRLYTYVQALSTSDKPLVTITDSPQELKDVSVLQADSGELINLANIHKFKLLLPQTINSQLIGSHFNSKMQCLVQVLGELQYLRVLVFVQKKIFLEQISERLVAAGLQTVLIHGSLPQFARIKLMNEANTAKIIITSDLLARGIDLRIDLVILFDAKRNDTFWHRIGRTGRYGRTGVAITLDDVQGWQTYDINTVQMLLNTIRQEQQDKKEWYGSHLADCGQWHQVDAEKESIVNSRYRYYDKEMFERDMEGKENIHADPTLKNTLECLIVRQKVLTVPTTFANHNQLVKYLSELMSCAKCSTFVQDIQKLTNYSFKLREYLLPPNTI